MVHQLARCLPRLPLALAAACLAVAGLAGAAVQWHDVTTEAGIVFRTAGEIHGNSSQWPSYPEIMGSGACWFDADGDGYEDLYLVNQRYNEQNPAWGPWADDADPHSKLYINQGDGTFRDASAEAGVDARIFGFGCSAADYDADGCVDLFVSGFGDSLLYHNQCDGTFTDATADLGIPLEGPEGCGDWPCFSTSSAWADYDDDGDVDLYVGNKVNTNLTDNIRGPNWHVAQVNWLFRNDGDGTFTEVAEAAGVQGNPTDEDGGKTLGVTWLDYDLDGDMDLYVCNDTVPNDLYRNDGDGAFTEVSNVSGTDDGRSSMGCVDGDYDNDGYPDLFFTHYEGQQNGFFRNRGDGTFEDRSGEDDLDSHFTLVGWGTAFVDFDRDMDLDIIAVNGHTEWDAFLYNQTSQVWRNDENLLQGAKPWDRNWTDVTRFSGPGISAKHVSRGAAFGDYDLDGDTDIIIVNNANQTANLLRASGQEHRWLTVQLRQPGMNPSAIGARVELVAGGLTQVREIEAGSSYLSQNTLLAEFGLGTHAAAQSLTVRWPDGGATTVQGPIAANQVVRVDRAAGALQPDTLSPLTRAHVAGTQGKAGWWTSPVEVALQPEDRGVSVRSGVASTERSVDGGPWAADDGPIPLAEGRHEVRMRSTDHAGNREPTRIQEVLVDTAAPEVTASLAGTRGQRGWWTSASVQVTLTATDATSGVAEIRYRIGDGAWTTYTAPFPVTADGIHTVTYLAEDAAGNVAAETSMEIRLDHTPPSARLLKPDIGVVYLGDRALADLITGPAYVLAVPDAVQPGTGSFTSEATASDATSGLDRVVFRLNQRDVATLPAGAGPYTWRWATSLAPSGVYEVKALATDLAGNVAEVKVRVVLAAATEAGLLATAQQGPSAFLGLGPVDAGGFAVPMPLAGEPRWARDEPAAT